MTNNVTDTTEKIICGLIHKTSGEVKIYDREHTDADVRANMGVLIDRHVRAPFLPALAGGETRPGVLALIAMRAPRLLGLIPLALNRDASSRTATDS